MQKTFKFYFLLLIGVLVMSSFVTTDAPPAKAIKMPKKVNAVVQSKCFGCHNTGGKNEKAKQALQWDALDGLPADQQLEKMKSIAGVLAEGSMPPARFLEGNPDKKLTADEVSRMTKWASKSVKKLSK